MAQAPMEKNKLGQLFKAGLFILLAIGLGACQGIKPSDSVASSSQNTSTLQHSSVKTDKDKGIGGTGAIARSGRDSDQGIGGTGVIAQSGRDSDQGIGGTGAVAQSGRDSDQGIGGTGAVAQSGRDSDQGIGSTGVIAQSGRDSDQGIGGTGAVAQRAKDSSSSDERGIGGTGMVADVPSDERGIGGTGVRTETEQTQRWLAQLQQGEKIGVVGTINDFGSIWVNGLHIHFDASTPITSDGKAVQVETLNLGQRAVVTAVLRDGKLWAESIELIHEVIGPVSSVDKDRGHFAVLGQNIRFSDELAGHRKLPTVGQWLKVSGLRNPQQQIVASRAVNITAQSDVLVRGQIRRDQGKIRLDQMVINDSKVDAARVKNQDFVVLRARLDRGELQQVQLEKIEPLQQKTNIRLFSVERLRGTLKQAGPYIRGVSKRRVDNNSKAGNHRIIEAQLKADHSFDVERISQKPPINWRAKPEKNHNPSDVRASGERDKPQARNDRPVPDKNKPVHAERPEHVERPAHPERPPKEHRSHRVRPERPPPPPPPPPKH